MDLYLFLIIVHIAGTILGVGGATMIEVALNRSLQDGKISEDEQNLLKPTYTVVRVGLALSILSGFGFLLIFKINGYTEGLYSPVLWAKLLIILVILLNTILLQAHKINLYWGSAFSLTSWWSAAILGLFSSNDVTLPFWQIIFAYLLIVVVMAYVLHLIRLFVKNRKSI